MAATAAHFGARPKRTLCGASAEQDGDGAVTAGVKGADGSGRVPPTSTSTGTQTSLTDSDGIDPSPRRGGGGGGFVGIRAAFPARTSPLPPPPQAAAATELPLPNGEPASTSSPPCDPGSDCFLPDTAASPKNQCTATWWQSVIRVAAEEAATAMTAATSPATGGTASELLRFGTDRLLALAPDLYAEKIAADALDRAEGNSSAVGDAAAATGGGGGLVRCARAYFLRQEGGARAARAACVALVVGVIAALKLEPAPGPRPPGTASTHFWSGATADSGSGAGAGGAGARRREGPTERGRRRLLTMARFLGLQVSVGRSGCARPSPRDCVCLLSCSLLSRGRRHQAQAWLDLCPRSSPAGAGRER